MPPATKSTSGGEPAKRRKTSSSSVASESGRSSCATRIDRVSLHAAVTKLEDEESLVSGSAEVHGSLFASTMADMRQLLKETLDHKLKGGKTASGPEVTELRIQASLHVLTLKKLNRLDKMRLKASRNLTNEAKLNVDALHLQLQNLLYEVMHLQKEINKCQQFKSKDEEIDLIPVEDFFRNASEASPSEEMDEHSLRLARLEYEGETRKTMNKAYKKLEASKKKLESIIGQKRERLAGLRPQLAELLDKARPVQEFLDLGVSMTKNKEQLQLARFLPSALFVLYCQISSYGRVSPKSLEVEILGDLDEANTFRMKKQSEDDAEEEDQGDEEEASIANDREKKGKNRRSSGGSKAKEVEPAAVARVRHLTQPHPLTVQVQVFQDVDKEKSSVVITFCYLFRLSLVAVKTQLINVGGSETTPTSTSSAILNPDTLLAHLLEDSDSGDVSPDPTTAHLLIGGSEEKAFLVKEEVGALYSWAQLVAGMEFPKLEDQKTNDMRQKEVNTEDRVIKPKTTVSRANVGRIIQAIRHRLLARLALQRQINHLEKARLCNVDLSTSIDSYWRQRLYEPQQAIKSKISNWTLVDWVQYTTLEVTRHLVEAGAVDGNDFYYRIQINRDKASLIVLLAIKPSYPDSAPVFCLNLHWRGEHNQANNEHIRQLESMLNCGLSTLGGVDEDDPGKEDSCCWDLLTVQLLRLLASLDVMLEAWDAMDRDGGKDFPREKLFFRPVRGRNRQLPLVFNPELKMFCQR